MDQPATYDVHGVTLRVEAKDRSLADAVAAFLKPYAVSRPSAAPYMFRLHYGGLSPQLGKPELDVFWQGTLPDGQPLVVRCGQGLREIDLPGAALVEIDLPRRQANVTIRPGAEWRLPDACILPVLCEFLGQAGHHVVHAASLVADVDGRRCAVLVSGASGAGKTTAALALANGGMGLLADDVTFVTPGPADSPPQVWGMRTRCKVSRQTLVMLPWLATLPRRPGITEEEFAVDPGGLFSLPGAATVPAGLILFLNTRNDRQHVVQVVDKTAALARLVSENVRAYETAAEGAAGRAFRALADLVRSSNVYSVSLCPRLENLYDTVIGLIRTTTPD